MYNYFATFGSFNNLAKVSIMSNMLYFCHLFTKNKLVMYPLMCVLLFLQITPKVLQVWVRILCAIPNSRLVVKCKPFCSDSVRQIFLSTLEQLGLEPLRVDLLPLILLNHDHMQAYSLMDIR